MRVQREALWEYLRAAMWVLPLLSVGISLVLGSVLTLVHIPQGSVLHFLNFEGTPDDARDLLTSIMSTIITVIALTLGLTVVALQLSSTQFSPRLLRNFLRDRPNQVVLSVFVATFSYAAAGLYTVGVSSGSRAQEFPRVAVTGALVLTFVSLLALVYFSHHLSHSLQIDEIMRIVERQTMTQIAADEHKSNVDDLPSPPVDAVAVPAVGSGYVQAVHTSAMLAAAAGSHIRVRFAALPGDYVIEGTPVAWAWGQARDELAKFATGIADAVRVGFERTPEEDPGLGIRQLVDVASKALSPAVNDPYTGVQAIHRISTILNLLARERLGPYRRVEGQSIVWVPAHSFADYLELACGQIRRYGASEPLVLRALLRMLEDVRHLNPEHTDAIREQARLIRSTAEASSAIPDDIGKVRAHVDALLATPGDLR